MAKLEKEVTNDIKMISEDLVEVKREMKDIKDKLILIKAELGNLASKNELKIMERYIDMWQPMNFITRNELNKLLEEKRKTQDL